MIKTIIFDFGDVFINLDKPAVERELEKLGIKNISEDMLHMSEEYEKGFINTYELINYFTHKFSNIRASEFTKAWNAIILNFPEHRLKFIEKLSASKTYKLILLSNTNALHIEKVIKNMGTEPYYRFKKCFDKFYLSHEIHFSKPNKDIYEFVLNENKLIADECLFIDDTKKNTEAASQLGIHVWNNNPKTEDIVNLFTAKEALF